jgi:hypothetical protein
LTQGEWGAHTITPIAWRSLWGAHTITPTAWRSQLAAEDVTPMYVKAEHIKYVLLLRCSENRRPVCDVSVCRCADVSDCDFIKLLRGQQTAAHCAEMTLQF